MNQPPAKGGTNPTNMSSINQELKELTAIMNSTSENKEKEYQDKFNDIQNRFTSEADKETIADFILNGFKEISTELSDIDRYLTIQEQLANIKEILPLSYIARTYFGKSTAWLQQRIYGYKVRGRVYSLSEKDVCTLNEALQDISKKFGSLTITL